MKDLKETSLSPRFDMSQVETYLISNNILECDFQVLGSTGI